MDNKIKLPVFVDDAILLMHSDEKRAIKDFEYKTVAIALSAEVAESISTAINYHDRLVGALKKSLIRMESDLVDIEGEWGIGRSLEQLEAAGELTEEVVEIRALLQELEQQK